MKTGCGTSGVERGKIKIQKITLQNFLNYKKKLINQRQFLPSKVNILYEVPELSDYPSFFQDRSRWISDNTPYNSYTELREAIEGVPFSKRVKCFLDSKKHEILNGRFIPSTNIVRELIPEFENYETLHHGIRNWIKNNTPYENIEQLKKNYIPGTLFPELVTTFLNSKKKEILEGQFIPFKKNIISLRPEFSEYKNLMNTVIRWIRNNTPYQYITEIIEMVNGIPIRDQLRNFLDLKKNEILEGCFIPTSKNLRNVNRAFGNYKNSHIVVAEWLMENSEFNDLTSLIEYFNPSKSNLGNLGRHGYTPEFDVLSYRIENAIKQIVRITNQNQIETLNCTTPFKTMKNIFIFLEKNSSWCFVDILTSEIFTRQDYDNGFIAFHHIDRDKSNDASDNLVFLLNTNHGIITRAQRFDEELDDFFQMLLIENVSLLKRGVIPENWKKGWEKLALERGIEINPSRFKRIRSNKTIFDRESRTRKLDEWF
jgi:hypothetical protein